jgi:hypothetical protein
VAILALIVCQKPAAAQIAQKLTDDFVLHHKIGGFAYLLWGKGLIIRAK